MTTFKQFAAIMALSALSAAPVLADTLVLKNGTRVSGFYEGGTARVVKFRGDDGATKDYDILQVEQIQFGAAPATTVGTVTVTPPRTTANPVLVPANQRPPAQPPSATAANTAFTIPTGSTVAIHLVDAINSETSKAGTTFVAVLDQPLSVGGLEVVPRGADVRGRITNVNEAGRVAGAAELGLELTQIYVNGIPYAVTTSEYKEAGENRAGQTARRAGAGAAIGAVIGAIAGGGRGAAIGAGVGAGAGTAAQVITKGEKLNIPAETRLEFVLRAPLVIAGK
jgi:hypothetical protein